MFKHRQAQSSKEDDVTPQENILPRCMCGEVDCNIPYGLCHCGCGGTTPLARQGVTKKGWVYGNPIKFMKGHRITRPPELVDAQPFKIDGVYCRLIPLSQGLHAIVWESDYEWLMQWKWSAWKDPLTGKYYALRNEPARLGTGKKRVYMHRQILGLNFGDERKGDHKEPIGTLDNRRSNLRISNAFEQNWNQYRSKRNKSGYKGVSYVPHCRKWKAQIRINGINLHLGMRDTAEEAWRELYVPMAVKYRGEFARVA